MVHFAEFVADHDREPLQQGIAVGGRGEGPLQRLELFLGQRLCAVIGRQIDLVSGDQETALTGFRGFQGAAQLDRRDARVACLEDDAEVALGAFAQPDRHADDGQQRQQADAQQDDGGLDDETTGDRHAVERRCPVSEECTSAGFADCTGSSGDFGRGPRRGEYR